MKKQRIQLIDRLEDSAAQVSEAVKQLSAAQIQNVSRQGEWSLHQALAHLRDTEAHVFAYRAARILKEDTPQVASFNQDDWMAQHYSAREPIEKIIAEFRAARRKLVKHLCATTDKDWTRCAIHPEYGNISLEYLALHAYAHTLEHLQQLLNAQEENLLNAANGK